MVQAIDGIPVRLRFSDAEREFAKYPKILRAVNQAKSKGWRCALEAEWDAAMVAYSGSSERWKFLDTIPFSKTMIALEIGIGFGQHTGEIASRVAHLAAC